MKITGKYLSKLVSKKALAAVFFCALAIIVFERNIFDFLAVPTQRVDANILVVEGWGGPGVTRAAVQEYETGVYSHVVVAASEVERDDEADPEEPSALQAAEALVKRGVPREKILVIAPVTDGWNKTAKAARAACAQIKEKGMKPRGLNLITVGLHARRSRLAYQHAIGPETPVGVVTVPIHRFTHRPWWTSRTGVFLVAKNFAGWIREWLFG